MKIKTVGVLAAVGMMLSSVTVWSLTDPRARPTVDDPEPTTALVATSNDPSFDKAQFTSGKTLMLEGRLGHAQLLADRENESFLFVNVSAEKDAGATAQPLNL